MPKETKEPPRQERTCFVLMPFASTFDRVYEEVIRAAIDPIDGLACTRADRIYATQPIMTTVWNSLQDAHIVLADLTGRNPNVLYELGLAHAIQKPVILITQSLHDVPFDLQSLPCHLYGQDRDSRKALRNKLHRAVSKYLLDAESGSSERLESYVVLERASPIANVIHGYKEALSRWEEIVGNATRRIYTLRTHYGEASAEDDIYTFLFSRLKDRLRPIQDFRRNLLLLDSPSTIAHTHNLVDELAETNGVQVRCYGGVGPALEILIADGTRAFIGLPMQDAKGVSAALEFDDPPVVRGFERAFNRLWTDSVVLFEGRKHTTSQEKDAIKAKAEIYAKFLGPLAQNTRNLLLNRPNTLEVLLKELRSWHEEG